MGNPSQFNYSDELKQSIGIAQSLAKEFSNEKFSPAHLLKAILHKEIGLRPFLESLDKDTYYMEEWAEVRIETCPKTGKVNEQPPADPYVQAVMLEADNIRLKLSKDDVDPVCVLASLSTPGVGFTYEQLKTFPVKPQEIIDALIEKTDLENVLAPESGDETKGSQEKKQNALLKFCIDKTSLARQGKLDPVVGRDREIRMISEILGRRSKPNVMIIGDPDGPEVHARMGSLERALRREINVTIYSEQEYRQKKRSHRGFITDLLNKPRILVAGGEDAL